MGLEAQVDQLGVLGVVVVVFGFDARVGQVADLDRQVRSFFAAACTIAPMSRWKTVR